MTFQAYLDNIQTKTGKSPEDFIRLAAEKGFTKHADLLKWLKSEFELGHGHATAMTHYILQAGAPKVTKTDKIASHFTTSKAAWRPVYDSLLKTVTAFGTDVKEAPTNSYISWVRDGSKFAIVQITAKRLDIGLKLPGHPPGGRMTESGAWNAMVTHRVQITTPEEIDAELITWLRQAYDQAG